MRTANRVLIFIEEDLPSYLLGVITVLILADVFGRYVFNSPLRAVAEASTIIVVWVVFLTAAAITRRGMHIAVDSFYRLFGPTPRFVLDVFNELLLAALFIFIGYHTILFLATGTFVIHPATGISQWFVTLAVAIGVVLSSAHSLARVARTIVQFRHSRAEYERKLEFFEIEAFDDLDTRGIQAVQTKFEREVLG